VGCDNVTSGVGGRHIYFRYNATSGAIVNNIIEQPEPEDVGIAVDILLIALQEIEISFSI